MHLMLRNVPYTQNVFGFEIIFKAELLCQHLSLILLPVGGVLT